MAFSILYIISFILEIYSNLVTYNSNIYNFTIFDFTPITSMILSFSRLLFGILKVSNSNVINHEPYDYLFTSYIVQGFNFVLYFFLLVLMETGYLRKFFNYFKLKFCLSEHNFVFSQEKLPDELLMNNNINNSLLLNQNNEQSGNIYQDINKKNNINPGRSSFYSIFVNDIKNTDSLNKPLIKYGQNRPIIIDSSDDDIIHSINREYLPETNLTSDIRKINPNVNKEKLKLDTRNDFTTRIEGLYKTFWFCCRKNVRAINNLNLGLEANEKFGLLGLNGSGKSTTFKTITNEILYDYGKISLFGFDTRKQFNNIRSKIGYCPQENPLFDFMKVGEILEFYSNLKTSFFPINEICKNFGLTKYLDTYCVNLSGGNKRKINICCCNNE